MRAHTRNSMVVVTCLLAGLVAAGRGVPVAADAAPSASPPSETGRYVVELEAGAVAAIRGHPMVMVPPSGSLPNGIGLALAQLRPQRVVVLG